MASEIDISNDLLSRHRRALATMAQIGTQVADGRSPMWFQFDGRQRQVAMATFSFLTS